MEVLEENRKNLRKRIAKDTLISLQGSDHKAFHVLHKGLVEFLRCDHVLPGDEAETILEESYRVGMAKGEALLDVTGVLDKSACCSFSIRTVSDCIISSTPMTSEDMGMRIHRDSSLNLKILKDMVSRIESGLYLYRNYTYLWHKIAFIADVMALGWKSEQKDAFVEQPRMGSDLGGYSAWLAYRAGKEEDCPEPEEWDPNLFLGEIQEKLNLYGERDCRPIEDRIDHRQFLFIKRIVAKQEKILKALFHRDEPLNFYIFTFLAEMQEKIQQETGQLSREILELMNQTFGHSGWGEELVGRMNPGDGKAEDFIHLIAVYSMRCRKDTMNLLGKDLYALYPLFERLKMYREQIQMKKDAEAAACNSSVSDEKEKGVFARGSRLEKYKGLLDKILDFSGLPDDFQTSFKDLMDQAVEADDLTGPDCLSLREELSRGYWEIYESCFLKVIDTDLKGFIPGVMLHLGVIDERLITNEQLWSVERYYTMNLYSQDPVPAMTLPYFLEKIYKAEIHPSVTEMGDSFNDVLKQQSKMSPKEKKAASRILEDTPEDRIHYEINRISTELAKLLSGNKKKALPFYASSALPGDPDNLFWSVEKAARHVENCRKRDFTLFFREVLFKYGSRSDIIQREIFPFFVFYPVFGSRPVMWQEMDGIRKDSPGRLFLPLFFEGKGEETLTKLLAHFRWELKKSMAGFNWTDPVEGGLVGAYYDYIQYYRKNPELSSEARKRIAEFIKRTSSDRDRFAEDYLGWLKYEYEGRIRLNAAARSIFYRFCPFPGDVRKKMATRPAYTPLETRFNNIRQKEIIRMKSKLKKTGSHDIPEEIRSYMRFLEAEDWE